MYKKIFLNTIIILLILAALAVVVSILWQIKIQMQEPVINNTGNVGLQPPPINLPDNNGSTESGIPPTPPPLIEPESIDSHIGSIATINTDYLTLSTIFGSRTVEIDGNTKFQKIFTTKTPPIPGQANPTRNLPAPETITWEDLAVGQSVEALAGKDIRGQTTFLATQINLIIKVD